MRWVKKDMLARFTDSKIPAKLEDAGGTCGCAVKGAQGGTGCRQSKKAEQEADGCWGAVVKCKVRVRGVCVMAMDKVGVKGARCGP